MINVVYDDSGSMYRTDSVVDTWCQAKYSMEVFAAMLGEKDTLNVYYMSDYRSGTGRGPRLVLHGKDGAATNVGKLHSEKQEQAIHRSILSERPIRIFPKPLPMRNGSLFLPTERLKTVLWVGTKSMLSSR